MASASRTMSTFDTERAVLHGYVATAQTIAATKAVTRVSFTFIDFCSSRVRFGLFDHVSLTPESSKSLARPELFTPNSSCVRSLSQGKTYCCCKRSVLAQCVARLFEFRGVSTPPRSASAADLNAKSFDRTLKEKLQ